MDSQQLLLPVVSVAVADLTNEELAVLNSCAQLGQDPRGRMFDYSRVRHLFTEADGTRMHQATREALAVVTMQRLKAA